MAKRDHRPCAYCDQPSQASVQSRTLKGRVYICMEKTCWETYWAGIPEAPATKKGRK